MSAAAATYRVLAHNYAFDSDNRIHSDDVASQFGFKGGLVPGVADFAYLARAAYDALGDRLLSGGVVEGKFIKPIYHGEIAEADARPQDGRPDCLALTLTNPEGVLCAAGTAELDAADPEPVFADYSAAAAIADEARPAPEVATFPAGTLLAAYEYRYDADAARTETGDMFVDPWPGQSGWHPASALHDANRILRANVALGPWIHTASRLQLYRAPGDGAWISLRGRVLDTYEKRGHVMTEADLALFADETPLARIKHTAIIRLAGQPAG